MKLGKSGVRAGLGWIVLALAMLAVFFLAACGSAATPVPPAATAILPEPTRPLPQATATAPPATATMPPAAAATVEATDSPLAAAFPLSEPGPYYSGRRKFVAQDASRGGKQVSITVWYPALLPEGTAGSRLRKLFPGDDRAPDRSGAPYPLLVSSTEMANSIAAVVVSHGFCWASVDGIDSYRLMGEQMYSQPLDILFALDTVASDPPEGLEGMIDAEHAGAIGYSFDGYNTLAMSGARIDPAQYLAQCPEPDAQTKAILGDNMSAFSCGPAEDWEAFSARAGEAITRSDDGLWQPMTDPRIRAVAPMACEGWWLFGERGLAAVDRPTLMIAATYDELYRENALIFDHLGTPDKAFISFVGPDHMMIFDSEMLARITHFVVAFFGYHLQGKAEYREHFSEGFVSQFDDLAWGVYAGP